MGFLELLAPLGLLSLVVAAMVLGEIMALLAVLWGIGYGGAAFGWLMDHVLDPVIVAAEPPLRNLWRRTRTFRRLIATILGSLRWVWRHPLATAAFGGSGAALIVATVAVVAYGALGWYFFIDTSDMPEIDSLLRYSPPQIAKIHDRNGEVMIELGLPFRQPVEYEQIPRAVEQATIAAEDMSFYRHDGLPKAEQWWVPNFAYLPYRWYTGKGGSTLTMQLERNHDPQLADWRARERGSELLVDSAILRLAAQGVGTRAINTALRKIREIKFALTIERELRERLSSKGAAKRLILARYLSTICYGYNMCGPESASRFFFDKPMQDLTVDEAALLASFMPAPSRRGQTVNTPEVRRAQKNQRDTIIRRMRRKGFITEPEAARAMERPVVIVGRLPDGRTEAPASVQTAMNELEQHGLDERPFYRGQLRLHTTIDMRIQRIVNQAAHIGLRNYRKYYGDRPSLQAAIVVMSNRGSIYAKYGGYPVRDRNNWTDLDHTKVHRQAGSAIKPFVYLSVFQRHPDYTPDRQVYDGGSYPVRMGGGKWHFVHNYKNDAEGWIPFWEALAQSRNVPTIKLAMEETTIGNIVETARIFGIQSGMKREPSTALGSSDLTVMELAQAYATIFSGGITAEPYVVDHITDTFGQTVWTHQPTVGRVDYPVRAIRYTQMLMRGAVRLPRGTAHALDTSDFGIQVMCKTGTSDDYADARLGCGTEGPDGATIAVWFGDGRGRISLGDKGTGARLALPVVEYIFKNIYGGTAPLGRPPAMSDDITEAVSDYRERAYPPSDK